MNRKKVSNSSKTSSNNNHKNIKVSKNSSKNKKIIFKDNFKNVSKSSKENTLQISGGELLEIKPQLPKLDEEKTSPPKESHNSNNNSSGENENSIWIKILAIGMFGIIILFWLTVIIFSISISTGTKIVEKNVTLITYSPIKVSFESYKSITDEKNSVTTSILGYLRKKTDINDAQNVDKYILDDYNNTIKILTNKNEELFTTNSRYTYNVSGLLQYNDGELVLEPYNITKQSRLVIEQKEQRLENVTVGRKAGVYIDLSDGWRKIFTLIGK